MTAAQRHSEDVVIRPLAPGDLDVADHVVRTAFGTFLGAPEPAAVFGDMQHARPRYAAGPDWAFVAERDREVVGSVFATRWGTFGFFGPLSVRPDLWDAGIASRLMVPVVDLFERWDVALAGLFTFAQSPKHIGLYQKFGFWPRELTAVMGRELDPGSSAHGSTHTLGELPESERAAALDAAREITDAIFEGLDLEHEIRAVIEQGLGDVVLLEDGEGLAAFAVCHADAGEAGSGVCYVKFAAVRPGAAAGADFEQLLDACERFASGRGLGRVVAGVSTARHDAYRRLLARGYRTALTGVRMHRPNLPGYSRDDVYVIDDLR